MLNNKKKKSILTFAIKFNMKFETRFTPKKL